MKLRIKGNSLRFRLSKSDVVRLAESGEISETVYFGSEPDARLSYSLTASSSDTQLSVLYTGQKITVSVSRDAISHWASVESEVGIYGSAETGREPLELLIEKDFACLDATEEENEDTFPNPTACQPVLN